MSYEKELWGKVDFLHERFKKKLSNTYNFEELINKYQNACQNFSKSLQFIQNKNHQLLSEKDNSIFNVINKLFAFIATQAQEYNTLFNNIKTNIFQSDLKNIEKFTNTEKHLFNYYKTCLNRYNNSKQNLEKVQKEFINNMKSCEKEIYKLKIIEKNPQKTKEEKEKKSYKTKNSIDYAKNSEEKYIACINDANKMRIDKDSIEKQILGFYQQIDCYNFEKITKFTGLFIDYNSKMNNKIYASLAELNNEYSKINIQNDLTLFIQNQRSQIKPDEEILFQPYTPEATLKTTSLTGDEKETEKLLIDYEIISKLREHFKNICDDLNMDEEHNKYRLRILSQKIFQDEQNSTFEEEEKSELITYLSNPQYRNYFIISASKQRTKSRYKRNEKILDDLGNIFDEILKYSEKAKNYEEARNSIIISQTFYTELTINNKIYKKYLFEYIVNNKWLKSLSFWEGFIEYTIQKELDLSKEMNNATISNETNEEKKQRISNICFSQMLPLTNNMIEFFIKRDIVKKTVDTFAKKYDIDEKTLQMIYENIDNCPEPELPLSMRQKKKDNIKKTYSLTYKEEIKLFKTFEKADRKPKKCLSLVKYKVKIRINDQKVNENKKVELNEILTNSKDTKALSFSDNTNDNNKEPVNDLKLTKGKSCNIEKKYALDKNESNSTSSKKKDKKSKKEKKK